MLCYVCDCCGQEKPRSDMVPIQFSIHPHKSMMLGRTENEFGYELFEYCSECATLHCVAMKNQKKLIREGRVRAEQV